MAEQAVEKYDYIIRIRSDFLVEPVEYTQESIQKISTNEIGCQYFAAFGIDDGTFTMTADMMYDFMELWKSAIEFEDLSPEAIAACAYESEWHNFLGENGYDFFGDDYYEFSKIGRVISIRVQSHLIGLKMIREGLASGKFSIPKKKECPWSKLLRWFTKKKK